MYIYIYIYIYRRDWHDFNQSVRASEPEALHPEPCILNPKT